MYQPPGSDHICYLCSGLASFMTMENSFPVSCVQEVGLPQTAAHLSRQLYWFRRERTQGKRLNEQLDGVSRQDR